MKTKNKKIACDLVDNFIEEFEKYCADNKFSGIEYYEFLHLTIAAAEKTIKENQDLYILRYGLEVNEKK